MPSGSGRPSTTRRRATASGRASGAGWPGTGWASGIAVAMLYIHPAPQTDLFLGSGDRLGAVLGGLVFARHRRRPRPWPSRRSATTASGSRTRASYPGALLNSTATAFIDEVTFRGAIFGTAARRSASRRTLANVIQTLLYALATRLGAPGRDRYLLATTIGIGLIGGWLTAVTGGHRGGVPGPRHHPVRGLPVHGPHRPDAAARPRGRGDREAPPTARWLAGHRDAGVGLAGSVSAARW